MIESALPLASASAPSVARVRGVPFTDLPKDLYIPPEALEVFFETFQGPLDLCAHLGQWSASRRAPVDDSDSRHGIDADFKCIAVANLIQHVRLKCRRHHLGIGGNTLTAGTREPFALLDFESQRLGGRRKTVRLFVNQVAKFFNLV